MAYHLINLYFRCSIRNIPLTNSYSIAVTVNSLLRLENEVTQYQSFVIILCGLDWGVIARNFCDRRFQKLQESKNFQIPRPSWG